MFHQQLPKSTMLMLLLFFSGLGGLLVLFLALHVEEFWTKFFSKLPPSWILLSSAHALKTFASRHALVTLNTLTFLRWRYCCFLVRVRQIMKKWTTAIFFIYHTTAKGDVWSDTSMITKQCVICEWMIKFTHLLKGYLKRCHGRWINIHHARSH